MSAFPLWFDLPAENSIVRDAVEDHNWQRFRGERLKGQPTTRKLELLVQWLDIWFATGYERTSLTQVRNYLDALARAGFIRVPLPDNELHRARDVAGITWEVIR